MRKTVKMIGKQGVRLVKCVGDEVEANFRAWFARNFVDSHAGRIGTISYGRAGALDDVLGDGVWYADAYARAWADYNEPATPDEVAYIVSHPLVAFQLCAGITDIRGLRCLRRGLTARVNALQRKSYRSRYYARDNARRRLLAAERRKIRRRTTLSPCPTPDEFRAAFAKVGESVAAKIFFGGLVHDLECHVDNCLRIDERGEIVGRNGGVKAWIAENVPELQGRYKTIMRYKALAKRVRQAAGVKDPVPTNWLLEGLAADGGKNPAAKNYYASKSQPSGAGSAWRVKDRHQKSGVENYYAIKSHYRDVGVARRRVAVMFSGCENTVVAAFERVDAELDRLVC